MFLDNFNAKELKSDILASALTEYPAMVRPMGQTKMVPLHTRTLIAITGNAIEISEDMARRMIVINFDARVEDPELRKFAPGFLDDVFDARPKLLTAALTIWRWGRLSKVATGKPLGSFELWARWCRDPLIALGCCDPIDRITEIKAADPKRRMLITLFESWWERHGNTPMKAADLCEEVKSLMNHHGEGSPSRPSGVDADKLADVIANQAKLTEQLVRLDSAADRATRRLTEMIKGQPSTSTSDAYNQFLRDQEDDQ